MQFDIPVLKQVALNWASAGLATSDSTSGYKPHPQHIWVALSEAIEKARTVNLSRGGSGHL